MADAPAAWTFPPDKKVLTGALIGAAVSVITSLAKRYGLDLPPELITALPLIFGFVAAYMVPMTQTEVASRVTNDIVRIANADPTNPTTAKVIRADEAQYVAAQDIASGAVPSPA